VAFSLYIFAGLIRAYPGPNIGFNFINDSICENKMGYLKDIPGLDIQHDKSVFIGTKTKYLLEKNSLKIWNPEDTSWDGFTIHDITNDTLTFITDDSILVKYVKVQPPALKEALYDQVIVSSSGCYGTCPINNVLLKRSGQVIYYGGQFNTANGLFISTISKNEFDEIEHQFGNAGFLNLKSNYDSGATDQNAITLTFIKGGKIIKQIRDYGSKSPADLQFAYIPVIYLYQHLKLTKLQMGNSPETLDNISFENSEHKFYNFSQSESFYLWSLLKDCPPTQQHFTPKYTARFDTDSLKGKIETDGRIFKFIMKTGKTTTYDLGYNYFERNGVIGKFKVKDE